MNDSPHVLLDLRYPDFTARHVFTAKLRFVIIISFWIVCAFLYPGLLTVEQPIMLVISGTFVVTTVCYAFILKGKAPVIFFIIELMADVAAQTVLLYLTGGPKSDFFTIYIIYCAAGGLFYNYRVSAIIAILVFFFYFGLLLATQWGWIQEFSYPFWQAGILLNMGILQKGSLLAVFLLVAVYGVRIASHFTQLREEALESKNRELVALNRVSSLTRSVMTFDRVVNEVLRGVLEGMDYTNAFLLYQDKDEGKIKFFAQKGSPMVQEIEKIWGLPLSRLYLPIDDQINPVYQATRKKKIIIRFELAEVMKGALPPIPRSQIESVQQRFGFRKFLSAPLVAEDKVLGALIGATQKPWIEPDAVRAFEGFADQAALTIDNAMLISELRKKNVELERVSRIKSEFLATMSHELRTPLTAVIGFSELVLEEVMGSLNQEQRESIREILVNGENLLHLINSLLDLAKIESGKMELSITPFSMKDLLERVQRMIASLIQKKGQGIVVRLPDPFPVVYADERKLQQILLNLLSNAIKFTPQGGQVAIEVQPVDTGFQVSVLDTGVGIRKADVNTVFESFRQVDSSYTREYQGSGLGLALVKQFVELHGGRIWVESEFGKGSKFTFFIPSRFPGDFRPTKTLEVSKNDPIIATK